jgi:hypothetical protein
MSDQSSERGRERKVQFLGGAQLDGAPVAFIIVLAAVVTALSFVPFSIVIGTGGSFAMSDAVFTLVGFILGPIAGLVSCVIGALIGIFVAPYTASVPILTISAAITAGFVGGTFIINRERSKWWIPTAVVIIIVYVIYFIKALANGVSLGVFFAESFINWSAILLFILPVRLLVARWVKDTNVVKLAVAMFLGTWITMGFAHLVPTTIAYFMFGWPNETFATLIPVVPVQHLVRSLGGMIIGTGVILGLRAIGLVKPKWAIY